MTISLLEEFDISSILCSEKCPEHQRGVLLASQGAPALHFVHARTNALAVLKIINGKNQ